MPDTPVVSYAESKGKRRFDWSGFLAIEAPSEEEWKAALTAAGSWDTCAVGSQRADLERRYTGEPERDSIAMLGIAFERHIRARDADAASVIYANIQLFCRPKKRSR